MAETSEQSVDEKMASLMEQISISQSSGKEDEAYQLKQELLQLKIDQNKELFEDAGRHNATGVSFQSQGLYEEALIEKKKALEMWSQILGDDDHKVIALSHSNIAVTLGSLGRRSEGIMHAESALYMRMRLSKGADDAELAQSYNNVGFTYRGLKKHQKALEHFEKCLEMRTRLNLYRRRDHNNYVESHTNIAGELEALGQVGEAMIHHKLAGEMKERLFYREPLDMTGPETVQDNPEPPALASLVPERVTPCHRDVAFIEKYRGIEREEVYPVSSPVRGRALIINIKDFPENSVCGSESREGSEVDVQKMEDLFKQLGFTVNTKINSKVIRDDVADEVAHPDHQELSAFILVLMSHGNGENAIQNASGELEYLENIYSLLATKNFKAMSGKPKLVIIQACSGPHHDSSGADKGSSEPAAATLKQDVVEVKDPAGKHSTLAPPTQHQDLFICTPSYPGYVALRSPESGSILLEAISAAFIKHAHHKHLTELMTVVRREVVKIVGKCDGGNDEAIISRMTPRVDDLLTKELYFFPGLNHHQLKLY